MNNTTRIALNSIYIYVGVIICTGISLLTVPLLLKNLGTNDYGLYNLVAGVIAMLAFLKSSMIVTVQRYMNVAYGANDILQVKKIFSVSFILYMFVALLTVFIIEALGPFISNGFLNIEENRVDAAVMLFQVLVISTLFTTISIPFDALFNVYEDMWLFSMFNSLEAVLRLVLALCLTFFENYDKLVIYAIGMSFIAILSFLLKYLVCRCKYREISFVKINKEDWAIVKSLFSFIGWNLYGTLARIFSTQGFAVVLNLFSGTSINAAYGISHQVNSNLQHFTSSVEKAFNPQIMKSEGMEDRDRVIQMSLLSTKYCALIYSLFAIPLFATLSYVFKIWLKTPPEHTIALTKIVIISSMISMISSGLSSSFYAIGKIKQYLCWLGSLMIFNVFIAYLIMRVGASVEQIVGQFIIVELMLLFVRLFYAKKLVNLAIERYFVTVFKPYVLTIVPPFIIALIFDCDDLKSFIVFVISIVFVYMISAYSLGMNKKEKEILINMLVSLKNKML